MLIIIFPPKEDRRIVILVLIFFSCLTSTFNYHSLSAGLIGVNGISLVQSIFAALNFQLPSSVHNGHFARRVPTVD